jgi:hypothetical protein
MKRHARLTTTALVALLAACSDHLSSRPDSVAEDQVTSVPDLSPGSTAQTIAALNLRSGPGTSHSVIRVLPMGTFVLIQSRSANWYQVTVEDDTGGMGWVSGRYLTPVATPDAGMNPGPDGGTTGPSCQSGDRTEFSGPIANTGIAVSVCSVCGASYVVATNSSGTAGQVSLDNGSQSVTVDVPAGGTVTSGNLADNPSDGTVTVCATAPSRACLPNAPQNQRYCDPFRAVTSLSPERIDQGVDYGGSGPIYAMGPGTIDQYFNRDDSGWPGRTFVSYKLSAGPAAGRTIYLAENIDLDPSLQSGSFVYGGTVLGTLVNASPNCETGWGVAGERVTAEHGCYQEGCTTALGVNFNTLLVCLNTPSGIAGQQTGCCPQPSGWPTDWCSALATWQ